MRALLVAVLLLLAAPAVADDELSEQTVLVVRPDGAALDVTVEHDAEAGWRFAVAGSDAWRDLPMIPDHAHLIVAVPPYGNRFAIIEASGITDLDADRIWIVSARGTLLAAYGLDDLQSADERAKAQRSISHLRWLADRDPVTVGTRVVRLATLAGRPLPILVR